MRESWGQGRTKVLLISQDVVGAKMAGPGIRYWELSRVLAAHCQVTLAAPVTEPLPRVPWRVHPLSFQKSAELDPLLAEADVVVSSGFMLYHYPQLEEMRTPWVVDMYIPFPTEGLAHYASHPMEGQLSAHRANSEMFWRFMTRGDFFLCASERQRDLYLGMLAALGRLNPWTFSQDPSLRRLIDVVPFGLPQEPPVHRKAVLKGVQKGIGREDKVILWGGGIWDWLDPLTLIRAVELLRDREDLRLYFLGRQHPFSSQVPEMAMYKRAKALSDALGLTGRRVFFGEWVPYEERANYLLEADVGVSLHSAGVEARFAFRTRVLDYIWAGLPMVLSEGDELAQFAQEHGLGIVVPPQDTNAVAEALLTLLEEGREARKARFSEAARIFSWKKVARPLVAFCSSPQPAVDRQKGYSVLFTEAAREGLTLQRARERVAELEELVQAYERGRFIRLMAWLKRVFGK